MAESDSLRWSARHVHTVSQLPQKLTLGRAYFVGDEQYIIVDHGNGPVIYGVKSGPQGMPGEPIPELQAQIDYLVQAVVNNAYNMMKFNDARKADNQSRLDDLAALEQKHNNELAAMDEKHNADIVQLQTTRNLDLQTLYNQIQKNSESIINIAALLEQECENLRDTENILLKLMIQSETIHNVSPIQADETITTADGYSWKILESSGSNTEGTLIFALNQ